MALNTLANDFASSNTLMEIEAPLPDDVVEMCGRTMYRINRYDQMPPFLMSLVTDSSLWMYLSSYGPLTAGRIDEDHALFPYFTDDQLHKSVGVSGPYTSIRVSSPSGEAVLWTPLSAFPGKPWIERNCYKTLLSDCIAFEEIDHNLGLTFRYSWTTSDRFGFIRSCTIENHSNSRDLSIEVLDGVVNVLPSEVSLGLQQKYSCLIDAYCRSEIVQGSPIALYSLTAQIVDSSEPVESLTTAVAWSSGLANPVILLSTSQCQSFVAGHNVRPETLNSGKRGAFLVRGEFDLAAGDSKSWQIVIDTNRGAADIERLTGIVTTERVADLLLNQGFETAASLEKFVASADGLQISGDNKATSHHASATLFNIMRGGVPNDGNLVDPDDFLSFVRTRNAKMLPIAQSCLTDTDHTIAIGRLVEKLSDNGTPVDLTRLALEYIPLTFSRRHGDPSRPWNRFSIKVKDAHGQASLNYAGNWRDIFQNWEALAASFPAFLPNMIAKFVNASTVDGYNPYRISREGIDWEIVDPEDPWSNIGYWGDHQIVYALRLLEMQDRIDPSSIEAMMVAPIYAYADVPYRIKPSDALFADPKHTIVYDYAAAESIAMRVASIGTDGKLVTGMSGQIVHVTLTEKLVVSALAKICNLVVDGGIWMNTQRPEWNDANNALVGNGLSMVTLCYLRRYLAFLRAKLVALSCDELEMSREVVAWLASVIAIFETRQPMLSSDTVSDADRRDLLSLLAKASSDYRCAIYASGPNRGGSVSTDTAIAFCDTANLYLDHSIRANFRPDGLMHSYNLLNLSQTGSASIDRLYEMLEGQVALLSSGILTPSESIDILDRLFASKLYRADVNSFILYPVRQLPAFLEKGVVQTEHVSTIPLLARLIESNSISIVERDTTGTVRFASSIRNAAALHAALDELASKPGWREDVNAGRDSVVSCYEAVFKHASFTGRSGTMYGYEGIGCTYWHMISKLLLAVKECAINARAAGESSTVLSGLVDHYYRVRDGLGFTKSSHLFGAFPPDPYSHTPANGGARQPGMTGQTKEDILARWGELGVEVNNGQLRFDPLMLRREEFIESPADWNVTGIDGTSRTIHLDPGSLAFTYCQTAVVYTLNKQRTAALHVQMLNGRTETLSGCILSQNLTRSVLERRGDILQIDVLIDADSLI